MLDMMYYSMDVDGHINRKTCRRDGFSVTVNQLTGGVISATLVSGVLSEHGAQSVRGINRCTVGQWITLDGVHCVSSF